MTQSNGTNNTTANLKCAEEYVVKRGDSFYLISHKLGVPLRDLLAANRDIHPARLMVGDVLCIPREEDHAILDNGAGAAGSASFSKPVNSAMGTGGATGGTAAGNETPTETPMETPTETPTETLPACPLDEQMTVQSGQTVADIQLTSLVSRNTLTTANPSIDLDQLTAGQVLCVPKENIPCPIPSTYTLCGDETLESVAIRFNLPVASLLRANPCLAPQDFEGGVTVIMPK